MPSFNPTIPEIAKAYENDPRTKIAMSLMASGTNTAPVATGKYAWADGIARALSGVSGALITKGQQKKFKTREEKYMADLAAAVNPSLGSQPPVDTGAPQMQSPQDILANGAKMPGPINGYGGGTFNIDGTQVTPPQTSYGQDRASIGPSSGPLQSVDPNAFLAPSTGGQGAAGGGVVAPLPPMAPQSAPQAVPAMAASAMARPAPTPPKPQGYIEPFKGFLDASPTSKMGAARQGGSSHNGEDFALPVGTPIVAPASGVVRVRENARGGKQVILQMDDGSRMGVAHLSAYNVKPGQRVEAGTVLGQSGNTGRSTGPHGHFTWTDPKRGRISIREGLANVAPQSAPVQDAGAAGIPQTPAQMEAVPEIDPAIANPARPEAPKLPGPVKSERLAIAQRLMATGNPDLMAIAQGYLDSGLTDKFTADTQANTQQFQQGQTGYQSDLGDFSDARSQGRANAYEDRRGAINRNFQRENREDDQAYGAANREDEQAQRMIELQFGRETQRELQTMQNDASWRQTQAEIEARGGTAEEKKQARLNGFYNTATGAKLFDKMQTELQQLNAAKVSLDRLDALVPKVKSGGMLGMPFVDGILGTANPDVAVFNELSSAFTLEKIGGSLGAQISNSDRDFIMRQAPSVKLPANANREIIAARRAVVERGIEYQNALIQNIADGTQAKFTKEWQAYVNSVSIKKNVTFEEWRANRPTFDNQAKRVK